MKKTDIVTELINKFCSKKSVGVEIGVYKGQMSTSILKKCSISYLYLIDPYESGYANFNEYPDCRQEIMDSRYNRVSKFFSEKYSKRATLIRKKSEDSYYNVPNNLDFIYIDGNHAYEYVLKDLQIWVPKVKIGGLIIGDDWYRKFPGVITAVQQFYTTGLLEPPCTNYKQFNFSKKHVNAPGTGTPVINKCKNTWWSLRK